MISRVVAAGAATFVLAFLLACREGVRRLPETGFQVEFPAHKIPSELEAGQTAAAAVSVKNISPIVWPSRPDGKGRYAVNLSYHWLGRNHETVIFDGLRTPLPRDLRPGESVELNASIQAPDKPGRYILEITLVQESAAWFSEKGSKLVLPVRVAESAVSSSVAPAGAPKEEKAVHAESQFGPWTVQLGSYAEQKVAANLAKRLRGKGYDADVTAVTVKGKELHRVRVGHLAERSDAERLRDTLKAVEKLDRGIVARR